MIGTTNRYVWLLVLLGYLTLWVPLAGAQKTVWEQYQRAGVHAYKQGLYTEAEQQLTTALEEAERLGLPDQRLTVSLSILALVYSAQNQPEKAEPLYQRLLILRETTLGPDHLEVAACLDNLAEVYEAQGEPLERNPSTTCSQHPRKSAQTDPSRDCCESSQPRWPLRSPGAVQSSRTALPAGP